MIGTLKARNPHSSPIDGKHETADFREFAVLGCLLCSIIHFLKLSSRAFPGNRAGLGFQEEVAMAFSAWLTLKGQKQGSIKGSSTKGKGSRGIESQYPRQSRGLDCVSRSKRLERGR